jgi:hypothetical protein
LSLRRAIFFTVSRGKASRNSLQANLTFAFFFRKFIGCLFISLIRSTVLETAYRTAKADGAGDSEAAALNAAVAAVTLAPPQRFKPRCLQRY